jgi:hypothetical protein
MPGDAAIKEKGKRVMDTHEPLLLSQANLRDLIYCLMHTREHLRWGEVDHISHREWAYGIDEDLELSEKETEDWGMRLWDIWRKLVAMLGEDAHARGSYLLTKVHDSK